MNLLKSLEKISFKWILMTVFFLAVSSILKAESQPVIYKGDFNIEQALGYSDNLFRAPADTYMDLFAGSAVSPTSQSGAFYLLDFSSEVSAHFINNVEPFAYFDFSGRRGLGSDIVAFNSKTVDLGGGLRLPGGKFVFRGLQLQLGLKNLDSVYTERDTGLPKTTSKGKNVSQRDDYSKTYGQVDIKLNLNKTKMKLKGLFSQFNHSDPIFISSYSRQYWETEMDVQRRLSSTLKLKAGVRLSDENYSDRPSRTLSGRALKKNPRLEYRNLGLNGGMVIKFSSAAFLFLDVLHKRRTDLFVGYKNYAANRVQGRLIFGRTGTSRLKLKGSYEKKDYPNAFAFDKKGQEKLSYETRKLSARFDQPLGKSFGLWIEGDFKGISSTDPRYAYQALRGMAGLSIEFNIVN